MNGAVSRDEIRQRVQNVFREVFEDPQLRVIDDTTATDIPRWDSLTHINLIMALEEEFGFQFTSDEVTSIACVGDLFTMIARKK